MTAIRPASRGLPGGYPASATALQPFAPLLRPWSWTTRGVVRRTRGGLREGPSRDHADHAHDADERTRPGDPRRARRLRRVARGLRIAHQPDRRRVPPAERVVPPAVGERAVHVAVSTVTVV